MPSATELDTARAALARAEASEASANANVAVARATLSTDETNLTKASIRSPIDGVVLSRSVDPGNAVAASLQAVTLFSVAENLAQLQLEASVDEADVGAVKVGQKATFTVSAYPSRRFPATIRRVAFGSTTTNNVVTYVATLDVDNSDLALRPGMTAVATIVATERNDVLLVPNTALRFSPTAAAGAGARSVRWRHPLQNDAAPTAQQQHQDRRHRSQGARLAPDLDLARRPTRAGVGADRHQRRSPDRSQRRHPGTRHGGDHRPAQRGRRMMDTTPTPTTTPQVDSSTETANLEPSGSAGATDPAQDRPKPDQPPGGSDPRSGGAWGHTDPAQGRSKPDQPPGGSDPRSGGAWGQHHRP